MAEQNTVVLKKKKSKPFAHSTSHRSAEFVATDNDEPEGSSSGGNTIAGGSSGIGGGNAGASGIGGGNVVASGSGGPSTSSREHMQEKRAKDLKALIVGERRHNVQRAQSAQQCRANHPQGKSSPSPMPATKVGRRAL
jgi:hypothetical protein